ncbi:MAG: DUF1045 domain-containing protein [Rhodospirillaceae bacterium]|nr:DUF1045 domain-containing protein [Rhodospirillaceae bacterium]
MMSQRYAVYFAPDTASDLWQMGCRWLGRDADDDKIVEPPYLALINRTELTAMTAIPAHYGFHATLKPPFYLVHGGTAEDLLTFAASFASQHAPVNLPGFQVTPIGRFIALVPTGAIEQLGQLAKASVEAFDEFRAPLTPEDLARRKHSTLTKRQSELLNLWGYPYVMDEFRFHLTLTGPLDASERARMLPILREYFSDVVLKPCPIDAIAIFVQESSDSPFRLLNRFALSG